MSCHLLIDNTLKVAKVLVSVLETRTLISTALLQKTMNDVFKGSDSQGAWIWKDAYDAVEVALVLYLKQRSQQLVAKGISSQEVLAELMVLEALCPTHTKRSQETLELQQFSTPISLAYIANVAGAIRKGDIVLEPSAGTGLLVASAEAYGGELILNEISPKRVGILRQVFAGAWITTVNGEQIDDYLRRDLTPTLVVMNPPFSASPKVSKRTPHATVKHIGSALARLQQGGRLVAIAANWFSPDNPRWRDTFVDWQRKAELVFSIGIAGKLYAKHGTSIDTRLFVFDKLPAPDPTVFLANPAIIGSSQELLKLVQTQVPHRQAVNTEGRKGTSSHGDRQSAHLSTVGEYHTALSTLPLFQYQAGAVAKRCLQSKVALSTQKEQKAKSSPKDFGSIVQIEYVVKDWQNTHKEIANGLYETYETQSITIAGAVEHPSPLVESVAMGSVAPPKPTYRPHLPERLLREGILSAPQIESIIYAGQAHQNHLNAYYLVDNSLEFATTVEKEELGAIRLRRGWFLGDGTGCGKGRQVAGIILDNYLQGRRQAIWVSKSDKLIEDARRDWTALGGDKTLIVPLSRFRQGESIELEEGIVFVTYATLRTEERQEKKSRVQQLIDWCKKDFQGIIAFDECHAMGNATSEQGERGIKKPSQQGIAGLRLQYGLPNARVVYVSATGATTIKNIAYATRLGLWQTKDFPFNSQSEFAASMEKGGIAAMEAISRDLKALGLYLSRALSYQGVQYEIVEHELSEEQIRIYDSYADAFGIIHQNIEAALQAANITDHKGKSRNANATSAVYSAFESNKQRFFNHLLTSMKCPTILRSIEQALADGHAVIVQLVSTNEALLERRLANIPASEWSDINLDITPREYVMDYLFHSFPVHLHEFYTDEKGNERSRAVVDAGGKPVVCQQALRLRDEMVEQLALLPSVPGALDQLIQYFGHEQVAEVTGRSKRVLLAKEANRERLYVQNRPGSANLSEAEAFMNDTKRILVFSEAGGTGRSYHADLNSTNQRLRIHYLLEAGWRADNAIQGLGRSNRTNQKQPPLYRPVTTNVKGEKRFTSTIARRLDSLGALTRGQRQTGGQGLFREEDNLESSYAKAALLQLYSALCNGSISCCTLVQFQKATGLSLLTEQGYIKEELPPISQFLNRVLALKIELQNALFEEFELRLASIVEGAIAAGTYAIGVETLNADNFHVLERREVFQHPQTGAKTTCCEIEKHTRTKVLLLDTALALAETKASQMVRNERSKRVALAVPTNSIVLDDGSIQKRVNIIGTIGNKKMPVEQLEQSHWVEIALHEFQQLWTEELSCAPQFTCETFYLVTGLLLPIWNCLPPDNMRVYRLQLNSGERMLGRVLQSEHLASVYTKLGIEGGPTLSASEIFHAVFNRKQVMQLGRKWQLRSSLIMGSKRLEVIGELQKAEVELLKRIGCTAEVINWKLRVFIPINDHAVSIIEQIQSLK